MKKIRFTMETVKPGEEVIMYEECTMEEQVIMLGEMAISTEEQLNTLSMYQDIMMENNHHDINEVKEDIADVKKLLVVTIIAIAAVGVGMAIKPVKEKMKKLKN